MSPSMHRVVSLAAAQRRVRPPVVLAVGFFDGVHRGHQRVLREAVRAARARGGQAWVLTFEDHPLRLIRPGLAPLLLTSAERKQRLLAAEGLDGCLWMRFTRSLQRMTAAQFLDRLVSGLPALRHVVVGHNWTFGRDRMAAAKGLEGLAGRRGLTVKLVPPAMWRGHPVSSTRIRAAVQAGRLGEARAMLGRPFGMAGRVIHGRGRGRKLGFPTANLHPDGDLFPPPGVYAGEVLMEDAWRPAAVVLLERGAGAARRERSPLIEAHVLDAGKINLYGRRLEVRLLRRLRAQRVFDSSRELARHIARDVERVRRLFAGRSPGNRIHPRRITRRLA